MAVTGDQIRAARALLRWSAQDLADRSKISLPTIQRLEGQAGTAGSKIKTVEAIEQALENAGVIFIPEDDDGVGVRLVKAAVRARLSGARKKAKR